MCILSAQLEYILFKTNVPSLFPVPHSQNVCSILNYQRNHTSSRIAIRFEHVAFYQCNYKHNYNEVMTNVFTQIDL